MSGTRTFLVTLEGIERSIQVRRIGDGTGGGRRYGIIVDDGPEEEVDAARPVSDVLSLLMVGRSWEAGLVATHDGFEVDLMGIRHTAQVMDPRRKALRMAGGAGEGVIRTQMPGRVVRILVEPGDELEEGQPAIVIEAMKMENELKSPRAGTVKSISVSEGDEIEARAVLIELD